MSFDNHGEPSFVRPRWPAPPNIRALCTTRFGGVSHPPWASLNLGDHVGDDSAHVQGNRKKLASACNLSPEAFGWLNQVHGTNAVALPASPEGLIPEADASYTETAGVVCAILSADCLPVILCDYDGTTVAAAHAGWRSLAGGVLENLVVQLGLPGHRLMAWLGPAIGPDVFEVGPEVKAAFVAHSPQAAEAFSMAGARSGHYLADIYLLARQRLEAMGVEQIFGGGFCTVTDSQRFYSYRRDGQTGRMATIIWKN